MRRATISDYRGQRVLLVGLGLHGGGVATVRWLVKQGAIIRVTDIKTAKQLAPSLAKLKKVRVDFHLGGYVSADWRWAQRIVVNPDISPAKHPQLVTAQRRGVAIENEASIFMAQFPGTVIGVTGTRGKTTTTLLLGDTLKQAHRQTIVSGNVRQVPMLEYLPRTTSATWAVVELSSFQLERLPVAKRPLHVAVMTNLKIDHLSRHGSLAAYTQAKYNIFRGQGTNDYKILNWSDPAGRRATKIGRGQVVWFGKQLPSHQNGVTVRGNWVVEQTDKQSRKLFPLQLWKLPGQHNLENLLAAVAAARAMNVSTATLRAVVRNFRGAPYRQQVIRTWQNHQLINDTAATSPDATLAALEIYPRGVFILGGTDKQLDLKPLAREIVHHNVPTVFLPGTATIVLQSALRHLGYRQPLVTVDSMSSAVQTALAIAAPKQSVVLSPGAASFGLFLHEFDRGEKFNQVVSRLA